MARFLGRVGAQVAQVHGGERARHRERLKIVEIQLHSQLAARLGDRVASPSQVGLQVSELHLEAKHVVVRRQAGTIERLGFIAILAHTSDRVVDETFLLLSEQ